MFSLLVSRFRKLTRFLPSHRASPNSMSFIFHTEDIEVVGTSFFFDTPKLEHANADEDRDTRCLISFFEEETAKRRDGKRQEPRRDT